MFEERCGVAVVGASAAGLAAARAAAMAGADVMLLEARDEVGVPPSPAIVAFDHLWPDEVPRPAYVVKRRLAGVVVSSPAGHALEVDAPLSLLDRVRFDRALLDEAQANLARVRTGVQNLRWAAPRTLEADGLRVRADVVVFADGPASLVRGILPTTRDPAALTWGAALHFHAPETGSADRIAMTLGEHAPGGRSQANPLGQGRWSHWTFYRGTREEAEARARAGLDLDARLAGWPAGLAKEARFEGVAPDPVYTLPHTLVGDGVAAVGGAAGQGGVEMGLAAGHLAGEVAAEAVAAGDTSRAGLLAYERRWKARHLDGYRMLRRVTDRLARLQDADLDRLLRPWDGRRIALPTSTSLHRAAPAMWRLARGNPRAVGPLFEALARSAWG